MSLKNRLKALEAAIPPLPPPRKSIPTDSLANFIRGLLAGDFGPGDIDRTDYAQMQVAGQFNACLVSLSPGHQEWCDKSEWGRQDQDRWEEANLSALTGEELEKLRYLAKLMHPPKEDQQELVSEEVNAEGGS